MLQFNLHKGGAVFPSSVEQDKVGRTTNVFINQAACSDRSRAMAGSELGEGGGGVK